MHISLDRAVPE